LLAQHDTMTPTYALQIFQNLMSYSFHTTTTTTCR
jgi:hypothetical protein